jgi:hypothetical protein
MSIDKLRERLDSLDEHPDETAQKLRDEWIADVRDVLSQMQRWLAPLGTRATVTTADFPFSEPDVGAYRAPGASIELHGVPASIDVTPAGLQIEGVRLTDGRFTAGMRGRISLSYGALKIPIVRRPDRTWWVSTFTHPDLRPLNDTTFSEALVDLLPEAVA